MRSFILLLLLSFIGIAFLGQPVQKHRVIILTDLEADPDDAQSLIRQFLYSNKLGIRGLIATTSCWHKDMVNPESIKKIVEAYGKVHPSCRHIKG